jgi:hypothetical protein
MGAGVNGRGVVNVGGVKSVSSVCEGCVTGGSVRGWRCEECELRVRGVCAEVSRPRVAARAAGERGLGFRWGRAGGQGVWGGAGGVSGWVGWVGKVGGHRVWIGLRWDGEGIRRCGAGCFMGFVRWWGGGFDPPSAGWRWQFPHLRGGLSSQQHRGPVLGRALLKRHERHSLPGSRRQRYRGGRAGASVFGQLGSPPCAVGPGVRVDGLAGVGARVRGRLGDCDCLYAPPSAGAGACAQDLSGGAVDGGAADASQPEEERGLDLRRGGGGVSGGLGATP